MSGTSLVVDVEFKPQMQVDFASLVERQYDVLGGPTLEDLLAEEDDSGGEEDDTDDEDGDEPNGGSDRNEGLDENKEQTGREDEKEPAKATNTKDSNSNTSRKRRVAVGKYDLNDPFLDQDEDIPWESSSQPIQEGFFVFRGTIGPKEGVTTEKSTKTAKRKATEAKNGAPKRRKANNDGEKKPSTPRKKKKSAQPAEPTSAANAEESNATQSHVDVPPKETSSEKASETPDRSGELKPTNNPRPARNDGEKTKKSREKKVDKPTAPAADASVKSGVKPDEKENGIKDSPAAGENTTERQEPVSETAPPNKPPTLEEILAARPGS